MQKEGIPRISVLVITYNQENLIERALNSILIQKEFVHEIIVSDDCSTDNNWNVISRIAKENPEIIKPYRNEKNLGIFGNIENLYSKPTGDMVFWIAGDDVFCNGIFEHAINVIEKNKIDFRNELFCIYFDYKMLYADGNSIVYSNKLILKNKNPISCKIRQLINSRGAGYSVKILNKMTPVRKDIGIYADGLQDIQLQMFATRNYYEAFVGSIYYAGIGVSREASIKEHYESMKIFHQELRKQLTLTSKDNYYLIFCEERVLLYLSFSIKQLFKTVMYFIKSIDLELGLSGLQLSKVFFTITKEIKKLIKN